jgi:hypothetical protein
MIETAYWSAASPKDEGRVGIKACFPNLTNEV